VVVVVERQRVVVVELVVVELEVIDHLFQADKKFY